MFVNNKGQLLIEVLIAIALSAILLPALITGLISSKEGEASQNQRAAAIGLLKETEEAIRSVREQDWDNFTTSGTYYPTSSGNAWTLASGVESINGFSRSLVINDVYRDENGVVVETGGTLDNSTKRVDVTVSWETPIANSVTSALYVTRFLGNDSTEQTSEEDFEEGTTDETEVVNNEGGEIELAASAIRSRWCEPELSTATIDLPNVPNSVWAEPFNIYVSSGNSNMSFAHVEVSDTSPPVGNILGTFTGYNAQDVYGEGDNYGYIATTHDDKEVVIIDLDTYTEVGYFNTETTFWIWTTNVTTDADNVFVLNNRGYVTAGNYLYVFDLSSKNGERSQIGSRISFANSSDYAGGLYVREIEGNTYAFISVEGSTVEELKIADVTNHNQSSQWQIDGDINIEPNNCSTLESGKSIYVNPGGTRAFISSTNDAAFKEFFTINSSNKSNPSLVGGFATNPPCTNGGGYEAGGMDPEGSVVLSTNESRAILVGVDAPGGPNSQEYQVLDLSDEAAPVQCGGLHINEGIFGIAAVEEPDTDAYAYLITGDTPEDIKIVQGGPDDVFGSGSYESGTLDFGDMVALNRITTSTILPPGTDIQFQIAATPPIAGSCDSVVFSYVGPDGTPGTYFGSSGGPIPLGGTGFSNPGQCVRYRAFLTTTETDVTPTLLDVSINYSP